MSEHYNDFKRELAADNRAEQPLLPPDIIGLLCKITDLYNDEEAKKNDNLPDIVPHRMLQIIIIDFATQHYPDSLQEIIQDSHRRNKNNGT